MLNALFKLYLEDRENEFCVQSIDDHMTLSTVPQPAASHISPEKKVELSMFGTVVALSLIYGQYPGRLNPLFLIYLLNNCNLSCLHRELVYDFFPDLGCDLDEWISIGPNDSIEHFSYHVASYYGIQVHFIFRFCHLVVSS